MRHRTAIAAAAAVALCAPAAAHADAPAGVQVKTCTTGSDPSERSATYKAWMNAVPGSARMAMRFALIERYPGHRPHARSNPQLSAWHTSHKGVTRYVYKQTVKQLGAGASYRAVVTFRWFDSHGNVIRTAKRVSGACVQDGELPNLVVAGVRIARRASSGNWVYAVTVTNRGAGAAAGFAVGLVVDGALADFRAVDGLDPGASSTIELNGPPCSRLRAVVDRGNAVAETNEDDNSLKKAC
jgi:hypothetical protein